jgi:hypothetical protein
MKIVFITILFCFALQVIMIAQTVPELEKKMSLLQKEWIEVKGELDSLTVIYDDQTGIIDKEKKRTKPDKDKIAKLMSQALTASDQLDSKREQLSNLDANINVIKKQLDKRYSHQIDSLQTLINSKKFTDNKENLESQILKLSEKRLLVSPTVKRLSFDPQRILQIQPNQYSDSLESAIYSDYLNKAVKEINTHLNEVKNTRREFDEIITLQEKTSSFLEDVAEDQNEGIFLAAENQAQTANEATFSGSPFGGDLSTSKSGIIYSQFQSYLAILQQLNRNNRIQQQYSWHSPVDSSSVTLTMKEYLQLLNDVEKELRSYKKIVQNKLKQ